MPRRRTPSRLANEDRGSFSIAVRDLANHLEQNSDAPFDGLAEREVRECANGLTFLNRLLAEYMRTNTNTSTYASIGLTDAMGIVDYLRTGRAHPISKYIDGLRTPEFRKRIGMTERGASEANSFEVMRRSMVVGAMLAIMRAKNTKRDPAIREVIKIAKDCDCELTKSQIIGWQNTFEVAGDIGPEAFCNHIQSLATKANTPIEVAASYVIQNSLDVAFPG